MFDPKTFLISVRKRQRIRHILGKILHNFGIFLLSAIFGQFFSNAGQIFKLPSKILVPIFFGEFLQIFLYFEINFSISIISAKIFLKI
jgi:hypothetical protein